MSKVYDLSTISSGVNYLKDGYIEYAKEVICGRALVNLYDGLKPVNRRIIVTLKNDKTKGFTKSARIVGNTLALHPHGDDAVYAAMVLMTDKNGSLAFPSIDGSGEFGGVYKTDPPAAKRYTEAKLSKNCDEYFGEMNGIKMIPNYDSTLSEPEVLPVSFPAVLVNSTSGIAVGFKSNIPSFNFNDVCDLVIEYIENGECHTVIAPDFVTGGYYVKDDKELLKLMETGKGKIKLRGKCVTVGKEIHVTEVPFGKTIQGLIKRINDQNFSSVRNAFDTDDYEHDEGFTVDCTAKNRVDEALYSMYKDTDFQYTYNADINVIKDKKPVRLGVWGVIEEWVKWRRQVLIKDYSYQIENLKVILYESKAFMNVVNAYDRKMELVRIITSEGREAGRKYVRENFTREEVPEDLIRFVSGRTITDYYDGGKYANEFATGQDRINALQHSIDNVDDVIVAQMNALKAKYGSKMQRRTEVTDVDYQFNDALEVNEKVVDNSSCAYSFANGFLKKVKYSLPDDNAEYQFDGYANDTLIAFDNRGRVLRVYCEDLPLDANSNLGTYLPKYLGLDETDDYKITWIGRLTGDTLMLLYKDGNVGFVDTSEWTSNNRRVKVLEKGISSDCANKLGAVITDIPETLFVTDVEGRVAWAYTDDIKRKDRKAKTRVFNLVRNAELDSFSCQSAVNSCLLFNNVGDYHGKLRALDEVDYRGTDEDFIPMM